MEPHVCLVNPRGSDSRGEWIAIANGGPTAVDLTGLEVTDYTARQQHVHIYRFPYSTDGTTIKLGPGQVCYLFTGTGQGSWFRASTGRMELHLFAGRAAPVWNNTGDVAYLRRVNGEFVSSLTVGYPARHPGGH